MGWEGILTILVVVGVLTALIRNAASPVVVMFSAIGVIMTAQALTGTDKLPTADDAVAGFGNSGLMTVGFPFVVVAGLVYTGALDRLVSPLLGRPRSVFQAQIRLLPMVSGLSGFLNNTPLVAMFIPIVKDLSKRTGIPASKLLLPLSYATIFGGTCTIIGTSTNLVVNGLVAASPDLTPIGFFELGWVGVPVAVLGLIYVFIFSDRLLPAREAAITFGNDPRRYTAEVLVAAGGPMVGKSIEKAGLRHLPGLFLAEIIRGGRVIPAVGPEEVLEADDGLVFVGILESVTDLHRMPGILPATKEIFKLQAPRDQRCLVEAVISPSCPLAGKSIREGRFREHYEAAVLAVARGGDRLKGRLGDIVLQAGDTLLLESDASFPERYANTRDFYLVSSIEDSVPRRHHRAWIAIVILLGMIGLASFEIMPMLNASLIAAGLMLFTGCCTGEEARRSIEWSVLLVIGGALGLGLALEQSGAAKSVAENLIGLAGGSPWMVLFIVVAVTSLVTELITNNAAAVLVFPIAMSAVETLDVNPTPFIVAIMLAASASFATPFGYQTNLMVYGPGGYCFSDYLRLGVPLNLMVLVVVTALAPLIWGF